MNVLALMLLTAGAYLWAHPRSACTERPGMSTTLARWRSRAKGWGPRRLRTVQRDDAALIGSALTGVAARLRAGQSPEAAWAAAAHVLPPHMGEHVRALQYGGGQPVRGELGHALLAAGAATRLARELGAELAPVLDACAQGIEESTRAQADRTAALAGPRTTANLLMWLPLVGVGIASVMGGEPWKLFTSTIWGALIAIIAAALLAAGRWWIRRMLHQANTTSEDHSG